MKTSIAKKIAEYKFQDNLKTVYATPIGHLCLFSCFAFPKMVGAVKNPFAILCFTIGLLFFIAIKLNNWQSNQLNLYLIFVYLIILFSEWWFLGIPNSTINTHERFSVRKGIMVELMSDLLPLIYVGMRIFLIIPLMMMACSSHRLNNNAL